MIVEGIEHCMKSTIFHLFYRFIPARQLGTCHIHREPAVVYAGQLLSQLIGMPQDGIVLENNFSPEALGLRPVHAVFCKDMFCPGKELSAGIAVAVAHRDIFLLILTAFTDLLILKVPGHPAVGYAQVVYCFIK